MAIVSIGDTFIYQNSTEVSARFFGTVVKSGANARGVYPDYTIHNGMLLQGTTNATLSLDALNIGSIRYPGGTESRYFRLGNAEDIAGLHRAIDYCAANDLLLNFTLHDSKYIKNTATQDVFLTAEERAELTHFVKDDLIGYAKSKGVQIESIHIGNEFQGRADEYGEPAWVGYAKVSSVLINELDSIIDTDPSLQTHRPDFVIHPNNWLSQADHDKFIDILTENIGQDGNSAASKLDAIDVHGSGTGGRTTTNTLELTWEDYFGVGDARSYESNIARKVNYWREDTRLGEIGIRNDAWAFADTPNLKDAAIAMLQMHTASEFGFESVTNYIGYGLDASALVRQAADQSSANVQISAGGALFVMMSNALIGTKAVGLVGDKTLAQEALDPILTRVFEGDNRSIMYMVNRVDQNAEVDLVATGMIAGNEAYIGGVNSAEVMVLGSDDPTNGLGTPTTRSFALNAAALEQGRTDFSLGAYETAQITLTAKGQFGTAVNDVLTASGGNTVLHGLEGNDYLTGSSNQDSLAGGAGQDTLIGGAGNDMLFGGSGRDVLDGGFGIDTANYAFAPSAVSVNLAAPAGNKGDAMGDTYISVENVIGSDLDDSLTGNTGANILFGGKGNDTLVETAGGDSYFGGSGLRDTLVLGQSNTILNLHTGANNKGMTFSGIENVVGHSGADAITGNIVANEISGRAGDDYISGFGGNDILFGNLGSDKIFGGRGDDTITGGPGSDTLFGGQGRNTFQFFNPTDGGDIIGDFKTDAQLGDIISLRANSFGKLAVGQLDEAHFVSRAADNSAQDIDDRFIYRNDDSTLWFDMDGTGRLSPTLLAKIDTEEGDEDTVFSASLIWLI